MSQNQKILCRVQINVVQGREMPDLDSMGGTCDSFVQIKIGPNTRKTKPCKKSLNPIWKEIFDIEVYDLSTPVEFTAYDWDALSKNDVIGAVQLQLGSLPPGKNDLWLPLGQVKDKTPAIQVVVEILPRVHIKLIDGKDLPKSDLLTGSSDPYIEFTVMKNVKRSATQKRTTNPQWNEEFDFEVHDMDQPIAIKAYDWDLGTKSDLIGEVIVTMTSLKIGHNDLTVSLSKGGSLHLDVEAMGFGTYSGGQIVVQPIQQSIQNIQHNVEQVKEVKKEFVELNTVTPKVQTTNTTTTTTTSSGNNTSSDHKSSDSKKDGKHKDKDGKKHKDGEHKKEKKEKKDGDKPKKEKKDKKEHKDKKDKKSGSSSSSDSSDSD
jgi:hypothetical protein